ncbi:putative toxin-antitoxin system toxin component, PIN family [Candidatus Gottesmanbacteria bacterium RIFCSPHIGHO2_01_FULL_46_14]|uniref:Putative toxin-antitoxin system toxin component, PIN family n=2 Tax=Candidatus Gottesmaniibacteriota TaxID=1752720 RepID=A0A1F5ZK26_9BACT|nr:MAG: putative toxin-antitoxin system toxin component, PIN family [Candidatus Gottesmanbacteria bacterium RIFCSPHIGHO2_01_FULL_46_14]OGG29869.1 MAG: putative toxin-antitoxin system toxin component, PIN family [Candidatus Gottesmanbacteria bacterium RIFCSPLOWO2_01_FULL_46_21]
MKIVFNASVLFSAFRSSKGGSRKLLTLLKKKQLQGMISEVILDETLKHADKIPMDRERLKGEIEKYFPKILPAPEKQHVEGYKNRMLDPGDAHLFATCQEAKATYLVSLDKHHVLSLNGKIKGIIILSPKQLLEIMRKYS